MRKLSILLFILGLLMIVCDICLLATPIGQDILHSYAFGTSHHAETDNPYQDNVEDTCVELIALYEHDKQIYMYLGDDVFSIVEYICRENARERANRTADIYNEYINNNKYVWGDNLPSNIYPYLDKIED